MSIFVQYVLELYCEGAEKEMMTSMAYLFMFIFRQNITDVRDINNYFTAQ